ncbi:hypothetical protein OIU78_028450 [Salix suchowensis]|nr:hypothetical protein OIU78_028450 [Salix suchowensis]
MEVAIPCLLQFARLTLPDDANIEESDDERNRMIQIKTEILEEKATTCVLLRDCVAETLVPLLNFYQHAEVRIAAALAMPEMLKPSKAAIDKRLLQNSPFEKLCSDIIPVLVEALVKEEVIKISAVMLDSELSGAVLNIDQIKRFLSVIMDVLDTSILIPEGNEVVFLRSYYLSTGYGEEGAEAVSALNANISDPIALHQDYVMAHDAAVTALGQI